VLADRDLKPLRQLADELNAQRSSSAFAIATDVGSEAANASLVADSEATFGPIDLFFANAGIGGGTDLSTSEENWNNAFNVNVHAHRWAAKYLLPGWLDRGDGYFCSTASAAGLLSQIGSAPYSMTKHAALAFAEWLSITYGNRGLKVSCLCPQGVNTNMLRGADDANDGPSGNVVRTAGVVLEPEQVAEVVVQVIGAETFLILPHPEVAGYVAKKATEHERWLAGMRKLQLRVLGV
jgi:NAD(P)-dependent dehydrogenase (short-subunit alcohol dehydrogenase family)